MKTYRLRLREPEGYSRVLLLGGRSTPAPPATIMDTTTNVLIVGGTPSLPDRMTTGILHMPFTYEGLSNAYRALVTRETVVFVPDRALVDNLPEAADVNRFDQAGTVHELITELGLLSPGSDDPVHDLVARCLDDIREAPPDRRTAFARRAAQVFFRHVLARTFNIVNTGGTVHLLLPEDCTGWSVEEQSFLRESLPGIEVGRDENWASTATGPFDWMLAGLSSALWFGLSEEYERTAQSEGWAGGSDPLPHPDRLMYWLPQDVPLRMGHGATDRSKRCRVLVLEWGEGRFVVGPASALPALLNRSNPKHTPRQAPAAKRKSRSGRKAATREDRTEDRKIHEQWVSAARISPGRLTVEMFAKDTGQPVQHVKRALDRHRKRLAAMPKARRT